MSKGIELTHKQWKVLEERLKQDYRPSVMLIRENCKSKLGFVPREYKEWNKKDNKWNKNCIVLDFYSEKKYTFFVIKYSEYLSKRIDPTNK
jgi:hypothetical protein